MDLFLGDRDEQEWGRIIAACERRELLPGDVLVRAGEAVRELLLIMDGTLEGRPADGAPRTLSAPSVAGELAFLDGGAQELTLTAQTPVTALRLTHPSFERLATADPVLGRAILADLGRLVAGRLRGTTDLLLKR